MAGKALNAIHSHTCLDGIPSPVEPSGETADTLPTPCLRDRQARRTQTPAPQKP